MSLFSSSFSSLNDLFDSDFEGDPIKESSSSLIDFFGELDPTDGETIALLLLLISIISLMLGVIFKFQYIISAILLGIGNSFFHVSGGKYVISKTNNNIVITENKKEVIKKPEIKKEIITKSTIIKEENKDKEKEILKKEEKDEEIKKGKKEVEKVDKIKDKKR